MSGLVRGIGAWQAASICVGTIIGTGVFLKAAVMAQIGGSAAWVLGARPFKVPGFPVVPLVFVLLATLLLVNTVITAPKPSALGLGMTALGALVFVVFLRGGARHTRDDDE